MGLATGIGVGIQFSRGGSQSWESYWASQPEVLFFGLYSEISGGQMPNKVTGSSDYLTVAGVPGSETYQCPNTAPYIAADTDYIWFKTDTSQRTATTTEMVGYDFTRTIVYYGDTTPNAIVAIMILSSALDTAKMRNEFHLSIWWDNTLSFYGYLKDNRGIGKSVWTPEPVYPAILDDGHTVFWGKFDEAATITKDGSNRISSWADFLGGAVSLAQGTGVNQPLWTSEGVKIDGAARRFKSAAITLNQPVTIYAVMRQDSWVNSNYFWDGSANNTGALEQYPTATPNVTMRAGSVPPGYTKFPAIGFHIIRLKFNGANSTLQCDADTKQTANAGSNNMGMITLGGMGALLGSSSLATYQDFIVRNISDADSDMSDIYNYLKTNRGL